MKQILRLTFCLIFIATLTPAFGQGFPQIWETSMYDFSHGEKGRLWMINYSGSATPNPNKAYIFAAGVTEGTTPSVTRDLFRLTLSGVSTFNSPYSGYPAIVQFAEKGTVTGKIQSREKGLIMNGNEMTVLGVYSRPHIVEISTERTTFFNTMQYVDEASQISLNFGKHPSKQYVGIYSKSSTPIFIGNPQYPSIIVDNSSNTYMGLTTEEYGQIPSNLKQKYNLFVKEGILSEDYSIAPIASWADFVFKPTYKLRPLVEVESYIKENGHLPEVPSEKDVANDGYSQHELNKALLQKIEELTLYIIQQDKEIQELKSQINK